MQRRNYAFLGVVGAIALLIRIVPVMRLGLSCAMDIDSGRYIELASGIRSGCGFARLVRVLASRPRWSARLAILCFWR
jgi:hypothetical protein